MNSRDKTQMVTLRVQVPTFSTVEASKKYLPVLLEALENATVEGSDHKAALAIRGASVGTIR